MKKSWLLALIILLNSQVVWSDDIQIMVMGLFNNTAVVKINNTQRLLTVGQTSPEGVKLISASSHKAIFDVNGEAKEYGLGSQIGGTFSPSPTQPVVNLWPINGMYLTPGTINGFSVNFIVDTGASTIALNAKTARRLGIDYLKGRKVGVKTASKVEIAYSIMLQQVQIGGIKLHNIEAMVIDGPEPEIALLGMTFLGQLSMERIDQKLQLKKKY